MIDIPLYLGWSQEYNGNGCDLSDKEVVKWEDLGKMFLHSTING